VGVTTRGPENPVKRAVRRTEKQREVLVGKFRGICAWQEGRKVEGGERVGEKEQRRDDNTEWGCRPLLLDWIEGRDPFSSKRKAESIGSASLLLTNRGAGSH